jgi:hypothetical protein
MIFKNGQRLDEVLRAAFMAGAAAAFDRTREGFNAEYASDHLMGDPADLTRHGGFGVEDLPEFKRALELSATEYFAAQPCLVREPGRTHDDPDASGVCICCGIQVEPD